MNSPYLVFADSQGNIYNHPHLRMLGCLLDKPDLVKEDEAISLPKGSSLFYLPGRIPLGYDPDKKAIQALEIYQGKRVYSVAAFAPPAFLRLYNPANLAIAKKNLPFFAYSACGFRGGKFYIAAKRVDKRVRQSPGFYDNQKIRKEVAKFNKKYPHNRLYQHLANCALNYNCLAAKNLFLKRWEGPLPTAQGCNARCLGCISLKTSEYIPPHSRINFKPTVEEVAEVALNHLKTAREAIISFGQGCEGDPLFETNLIAESVVKIREKTQRGTINVNTNASYPKRIEKLAKAGVDSFRVSLNSPCEQYYNAYFRPKDYSFKDVLDSIAAAKKYEKFVSINLLIFPGFSDSTSQIKELIKFIKKAKIDMIQWRNLNIDPAYYLSKIKYKNLRPQKIKALLEAVKKEFPKLKTGYFNLPKENF